LSNSPLKLNHFLSSSLFLALLTLLGIGLVQVYSASFVFATESYGDGLFFFKRQLFFVMIGILVMILTAQIPFSWIQKYGWVLWGLAGLGVAMTLIPGLGIRAGGAARWIKLPAAGRFEPGELLKMTVSLMFASLFCRRQTELSRVPWPFILLLTVLPLVLLLNQPDFGTFTILLLVTLGLLFAYGLQWRYIIPTILVLVPTFYFLIMSVPYRRARILGFLDPWSDPAERGFQVIQSMLSFHSGGFWGVGLGQGQGKLFFLPEAHTDFTLAVFGEEMGFIGFLTLLALYGFIVIRGFQISLKTQDHFKRMIALGSSLTLASSFFINCGVVMGLLPTKGLTLPFLSYGGSSLVAFCFMYGIVLNIEAQGETK